MRATKKLKLLFICIIIIGIISPTVLNANEANEEEIVDENKRETDETDSSNRVEDSEVTNASIIENDEIIQLKGTGLIANQTTLVEAFPDANFRTYIAKIVLGNTDYYDDSDKSIVLTSTNIKRITNRTALDISNKEIESLEGIQYFSSLISLYCHNNKLSFLDVSGLVNLKTLYCYNNQLSSLNVQGLSNLEILRTQVNNLYDLDVTSCTNLKELLCNNNQLLSLKIYGLFRLTTLNCNNNEITGNLDLSGLTSLSVIYCEKNQITSLDMSDSASISIIRCYSNPITNLIISPSAQITLTKLYYHYTNVSSLDLSGFSSLTVLTATNARNVDFSGMTDYYFSGDQEAGSALVSLAGDSGFMSWDDNLGYYVINEGMNALYGFSIPYEGESSNDFLGLSKADYLDLSQGGLLDENGNLMIGFTANDISGDGSVTISSNKSIASGEGTYTFNGNATIKNGVITTDGDFIFRKNTVVYDENQGKYIASLGAIETTIEVGDGEVVINTKSNEMLLPRRSVIINNNGDRTYLPSSGICSSDGNVSSDDTIFTVPFEKVKDILITENGIIVAPPGSLVIYSDTTISVPEGGIIYKPEIDEMIEINSDTIEIDGDSLNELVVGDTFMLSTNMISGEWSYSGDCLDIVSIERSLFRIDFISEDAISFTAVQSGEANIGYSINGVKKEITLTISDVSVIEPETPTINDGFPTDNIDVKSELISNNPVENPKVNNNNNNDNKPSNAIIIEGSLRSFRYISTKDKTNNITFYTMAFISILAMILLLINKRITIYKKK